MIPIGFIILLTVLLNSRNIILYDEEIIYPSSFGLNFLKLITILLNNYEIFKDAVLNRAVIRLIQFSLLATLNQSWGLS